MQALAVYWPEPAERRRIIMDCSFFSSGTNYFASLGNNLFRCHRSFVRRRFPFPVVPLPPYPPPPPPLLSCLFSATRRPFPSRLSFYGLPCWEIQLSYSDSNQIQVSAVTEWGVGRNKEQQHKTSAEYDNIGSWAACLLLSSVCEANFWTTFR